MIRRGGDQPYSGHMDWYTRYGEWSDENRDRLDIAITGVVLLIGVPLAVATGRGSEWFLGSTLLGRGRVFLRFSCSPLLRSGIDTRSR